MLKGIIFDLDGTLLDTSYDLQDNMNKMLEHFSYPKISHEKVKQVIGHGALEFVKSSIPETEIKNAEECLKVYSKFYNESGSPKTAPYLGILNLLENLKNRGLKMFVLSNKPQASTDKVIEKYLPNYFNYVFGNRPEFLPKPSSESTLYILNKFNLNPQDVVFVGDGETDVLTALNSKTKGISVLWGYRNKKQLEEVGAKIFAKTICELEELILEM